MDKASRKRLLPSVDELMSQSKMKKGVIHGLKDAHRRLKDVNFSDVSTKELGMLSEEELVSWLIAKLGFYKSVSLFSAVNMIPNSVTAKQRIHLICKFCVIPESEFKDVEPLLQAIDERNVNPTVATFQDPLVLAPPVNQCYDCNHHLTFNHLTQVKCYTLSGANDITKVTLRCKGCGISYNYAHFGDKGDLGFRYYPTRRQYVEVSDTVYFHRQLLELQCALA